VYVVAIAVGYVLPTVGVVLYLAIALAMGVPARTVHRLLRRR
jgi:small basic protein